MRPGQDDIKMACSSVIYKRGKLAHLAHTTIRPPIDIFCRCLRSLLLVPLVARSSLIRRS